MDVPFCLMQCARGFTGNVFSFSLLSAPICSVDHMFRIQIPLFLSAGTSVVGGLSPVGAAVASPEDWPSLSFISLRSTLISEIIAGTARNLLKSLFRDPRKDVPAVVSSINLGVDFDLGICRNKVLR